MSLLTNLQQYLHLYTSKATTSAVAERNRRPKDRNLLALCQRRRRRGSVPGPTILFVCGVLPPRNHPRVSKLKRRFRSATADVVALEVGVDIAADS